MSAQNAAPGRGWDPRFLFAAGAFGVAVGYAAGLALLFRSHQWILTASGRPVPCDFLALWTAGRLALAGHASVAYDTTAFHAAQNAAAGPFRDFLFWNYPPAFFGVVVLLAGLPYVASFLAWTVSTCAAYAFAIGSIARRWEGGLAALASPVVILTAFGGQNGFLSAALLGGFLLLLPGRPVLSGVLLGLLTYKPQLGIVIPFALIAGREWRSIGSAAATAVALAAGALAFGADTYTSFVGSLPVVSHAYLTLGGEGWPKMHSIYSVWRFAGAGDGQAWAAQAFAFCGCVAASITLWRRELPYELKAAGLVVATMLSTPYLHVYDFPVMVVAMAFLYRQRPFDRVEWSVLAVANACMCLCLADIAPIGPGIVAMVGALVVRRVVGHLRRPAAGAHIAVLAELPGAGRA